MRVGECEVRGVLHQVLHVPSLVNNLFLVNKITAQGLKIKIEQEKCWRNFCKSGKGKYILHIVVFTCINS